MISALTMSDFENYMGCRADCVLAAGYCQWPGPFFVLIVVLFLKMPKETERIGVKSIVVRIGGTVLLLVIMLKAVAATNALSDNFENLAEAYKDYGFAYCFCNSLVKSGISEPDVYNQARMKKIADDLHKGFRRNPWRISCPPRGIHRRSSITIRGRFTIGMKSFRNWALTALFLRNICMIWNIRRRTGRRMRSCRT